MKRVFAKRGGAVLWVVLGGAALVLVSGCGNACGADPEAPTAAPASVDPLAPALDPFAHEVATPPAVAPRPIELPEGAGLAVSASSVDAAAAAIGRLLGEPFDAGRILDPLVGTMGVTDLGWVDTSAPAWLTLLNPTGVDFGEVLVLRHRGRDAVLAALPSGSAEAPPAPHTAAFRHTGRPVFVDLVGEHHVVLTRRGTAILAVEAWVAALEAPGAPTPEQPLELLVDVDALQEPMAGSLAQLRAWDGSGHAPAGIFLPLPPPALLALFDNASQVRVAVDADDAAVRATIQVRPLAGAALALLPPALAGQTAFDLGRLPAGTWAAAGLRVGPSPLAVAAATRAVTEAWAQLLDLTPEEREAAAERWRSLLGSWAGRLVLSLRADADGTLLGALCAGIDLKDGRVARAMADRLAGTLWERGLARWQNGEIGPEAMPGPPGDFDSLPQVLAVLNERLEPVGLRASSSRRRDELSLDVLTVDIDWLRYGGGKVPAGLQALLGPRLELALGMRGELAALCVGFDASADAADQVAGQWGDGGSALPATRPGVALAAAVSPKRLDELYAHLLPEGAGPMGALPDEAMFTIEAADAGGWLEVSASAPRVLVGKAFEPLAESLGAAPEPPSE